LTGEMIAGLPRSSWTVVASRHPRQRYPLRRQCHLYARPVYTKME